MTEILELEDFKNTVKLESKRNWWGQNKTEVEKVDEKLLWEVADNLHQYFSFEDFAKLVVK